MARACRIRAGLKNQAELGAGSKTLTALRHPKAMEFAEVREAVSATADFRLRDGGHVRDADARRDPVKRQTPVDSL
jgi:hypothetical protein